ncbi:MAG: sensor histidine kinase [Nitriliruptorales bacterium]|nr:sensor histidine kinase [Nitriliruptorales bacterium]
MALPPSRRGSRVTSTTTTKSNVAAFRHEAVFYGGLDGFVRAVAPFVRAGVDAGQPVMVVVAASKIDLLRQSLGSRARHVEFADMGDVGRNPARIIPAWTEFVNRHPDAPTLWGVGEPIDTRRSAAELAECQRHEALLNVAFEDAPPLWLQCPYDLDALNPSVISEARRSHPFVGEGLEPERNREYVDRGDAAAGFDEPLPEPPTAAASLPFTSGWLNTIRDFVDGRARVAGLSSAKASDLVLAINELATNSLRHGGGQGMLRVWEDEHGLVCEVADSGTLHEPLLGRQRPSAGRLGGRGLWMVNQLCDLVQIRSLATGTVVRVHAYHD